MAFVFNNTLVLFSYSLFPPKKKCAEKLSHRPCSKSINFSRLTR
jgi:hypothetical protein